MVSKKVTIEIPAGLETRPVAMLVQIANQYNSSIHIESGTKKVNAKSIMGMMTLGILPGDEVLITADGEDEKEAVNKLEEYLRN